MRPSEKRNLAVFAVLCVVCVGAIIVFAVSTKQRPSSIAPTAPESTSAVKHPPSPAAPAASITPPHINPPDINPTQPQTKTSGSPRKQVPSTPLQSSNAESAALYFRTNALGGNYGKLTVVSLPSLSHPQYSTELSCERIYFAKGSGVCLVADRGMFTSFYAVTFDKQLRRGKTITLNGEPSRVRVSPDGRWAAITVFLSGHSYSSLAFSTQTTIVDMTDAKTVCDLEQFSVTRDGVPFKSPDFNFWGVTFTRDGKRFYATLWSKGKTYLVEGSIQQRTAHVIYNEVECPSLSPDNTRIAFKKRIGSGRPGWNIHLLDLATLTEIALGETRNVDDQVEWLDNSHILYALSENPNGASASTDLWELSTKPGAAPRLFLRGAFSPAVVNPTR